MSKPAIHEPRRMTADELMACAIKQPECERYDLVAIQPCSRHWGQARRAIGRPVAVASFSAKESYSGFSPIMWKELNTLVISSLSDVASPLAGVIIKKATM